MEEEMQLEKKRRKANQKRNIDMIDWGTIDGTKDQYFFKRRALVAYACHDNYLSVVQLYVPKFYIYFQTKRSTSFRLLSWKQKHRTNMCNKKGLEICLLVSSEYMDKCCKEDLHIRLECTTLYPCFRWA